MNKAGAQVPTLETKDPAMATLAPKILVVSHDPALADIRKAVLERAGFKVIAAKSDSEISDICKKKKPHLVVIGYSLTPAAKRRVWDEARRSARSPFLNCTAKNRRN